MDETSREHQSQQQNQQQKSIDERVHQQLVYKDNRIVDLNNVILDKERQILDLQERVREHNEVASVKNQAMRIVQQKFEEMNRDKKDMSTETEPGLLTSSGSMTSSSKHTERRARSSSPGHVIASRKSMTSTSSGGPSSSGTFSPPPIDPLFDPHSGLPDIDGLHRKHHHNQRKRVTFDLNPNAPPSILTTSLRHQNQNQSTFTSSGSSHQNSEALEHAYTEISSENALLRQQIAEMTSSFEKIKNESETEIVKWSKEAKTAGLKAKVAATARIKELETALEQINAKYDDETDRLQEEVETLRSSRNWEIEQNGHLRDQVAHLKEKAHKLTEELDASEKAKRSLDSEVEESKKLMELMVDDLLQAENAINYHANQKTAIFEDIDRLKEAIVAQDRFIEILEADIVIYEQHIGLLRENLGASQIDHRALIKSKAFETKLLALEREKEQIDKKSNEDRLKTKALDKKCRVLVEQNEQLMARLCELEMSHGGADEAKTRRLADQDERIRQISSALESERDVSQRLREAKEGLERDLMAKRKQEEASHNRLQMDVEMSKMEAQNKIAEMSVEVELAQKKMTEVMAEVEQLRATNFDLQMHIETAKRTMEELADSNEELEKKIEQIEEECEEKDEDLKQSTWDVETLTRQNEALRVELDGIRQGFHETRELSDEVKQLKTELQRQQEVHRAQFEAACNRLDSEGDDEVSERKTSLEVQQEQYIEAYELKIQEMTREMEQLRKELELKNGPVQRKTTAVLEPPKIEEIQMQMTSVVLTSEAAPVAPEPTDPELLKAHEQLKREIDELKVKNMDFAEKMMRLEMEAKLSGELNVELGRAMLELEEHNELLRKEQEAVTAEDVATGRELELHVMMVQEMTEQIATMQERIDELENEKKEHLEQVEKLKGEVTAAHQQIKAANAEVQRLLHNLADSEMARKDEFDEATAAHDAEMKEFALKMEDARRDIAELEAKIIRMEAEKAEVPVLQETHILTQAGPEVLAENPSEVLQNPSNLAQNQPILTVQVPSNLAENALESTLEAPESSLEAATPSESQELLLQNVTRDMAKLHELKDELEIAVEALKAEIWSLNGQLKASILDREALEDRVTELDDLMEKEKKRAISLDVELQEQVDLTERAVRRAAEAENESNQRMAECLEKETRREEIEQAYTQLNEYYNQLQEAYNTVYAQLATAQQQQQESSTSSDVPTTSSTLLTSSAIPTSSESPEVFRILDGIMTVLLMSRSDVSISSTTQEKLEKVAEKVKHFVAEYDENQKALEEQRRITVALEARLQELETSGNTTATSTRDRVEQLEGEIEWKEEECEGLKRRIRELEKALEAVAERADETEAAAVSRLSTELAILAARLTTRQADVDSLFRTNAELAHTNVRLQNEIDEMDEWKAKALEEKEELEQHVKELEEQVADLMQQHETHLRQSPILIQSTATPILSPEASTQLEESEKEVQRLSAIEKTLNTRILALEDQNMELEEKVQEIEEEMATAKQELAEEKSTKKAKNPSETADDAWGDDDAWETNELQEAKTEVGRLLEIEKTLTMRMEMLRVTNEQLEQKVKDFEEKAATSSASSIPSSQKQDDVTTTAATEDDDWGWGDEQESTSKAPESTVTSPDDLELQEAKTEITRLTQIEKVLNNRILALEDQNLELEERLQELEEELAQEKSAKKAENPSETPAQEDDNWGDWGEEEETQKAEEKVEDVKKSDSEDVTALQKTISELQARVVFQKEVIEKAEAELIETQDKYDELDEAYQNAQQAQNPNKQLSEKLAHLEALLKQAENEKQAFKENLERIQAEKAELEAKKEQDDGGWNDEGWGEEKEEKVDSEELQTLRESHELLTQRISKLEAENTEIQSEMTQKITQIEAEKTKIHKDLLKTRQDLEDVKKELSEKTSSEWGNDDDAWNDDGEIDRMKETQTVLEMKVEALQEELMSVKERELELIEENTALQARLRTLQSELEDVKKQLSEAESAGWNDDDAWNEDPKPSDNSEDVARLESEVERLQTQLGRFQSAPEELEKLKAALKLVQDQNGLLKDSEARLLDHADEFAVQMDKYREECRLLKTRIAGLEAEIREKGADEKTMKTSSDELVKLRQQLSNAQAEIRSQNSTISDREGLISELRLKISELTKTIEELQTRLKTLSSTARRHQNPVTARGISTSSSQHQNPNASRPSSRLSTSSRMSTASSSFVPEAMSVPLQSTGSAFDVVVPQSGEPLRRRNK